MHKPRNLTFTTLTEVVAAESGVPLRTVVLVLRTFIDVVGRTVASGFRVNITNFGTWYRSEVSPRYVINPNSGEEWMQKRTNYPRFRVAPLFRDTVRSGRVPETLRKRGQNQVR